MQYLFIFNYSKVYFIKLHFCLILLFPIQSFAQNNSQENSKTQTIRPLGMYLSGQFGFVYRHKPDMDHLITGHIRGLNLYLFRNYSGEKTWETNFAHPSAGFHIQTVCLNNAVLGNAYALMPFIRFPLNGIRKNPLRFTVSSGLAWLSTPFNIEKNHKNVAIASHINSAFHFELGYDYHFTDRLKMGLGISLTHYSNGAWSVPNTGINLFSANLGLGYNIGESKEKTLVKDKSYTPKWSWMVWAGCSGKEVFPVNREKFLAGSVGLNISKRISNKSSFGTGLDVLYDSSLPERMRRVGLEPNLFNTMRIGTGIRYILHFNRIELPIEQMVYLLAQYNNDTRLYQRIGIRYHINKKLIAGATLKTHFAKADYTEWHIGYKIN
jgi:hypothetical protein